MTKNLYSKIGEMDYDGLIANIIPPIQVAGGTVSKLATAATYARGTVLAKSKSDNKLYILGTAGQTSQTFAGDGSNKAFTITAKPAQVDKVEVGGVEVGIASYVASTGVATLNEAPANAASVKAYYGECVPDCILTDEVLIGTSADVPAAIYTAGCFDPDKVTVASGYTMTEADKDKLRERGIVFKAAFAGN